MGYAVVGAESGMWVTTQLADWTVHVHPAGDTVPHDLTENCVCGPAPELHTANDGGDNWLYIHHSLDGREANESSTEGDD